MLRGNKTIIITVAVVLTILLLGFIILYSNGLSGLHKHKKVGEDKIKVACVGDSITYGHGVEAWGKNNYPSQLQRILGDKYHVENFGHSGKTVSDSGDQPYTKSKQYQLSLDFEADILVFMLGTNDSKPENWTNEVDFIAKYNSLINKYKENNPNIRIIICTPAKAFFSDGKTSGTTNFDVQPQVVESIRNTIRTYAFANGYEVVDIFDLSQYHAEWFEKDNVHPSADGARAMSEAIAKKITGK